MSKPLKEVKNELKKKMRRIDSLWNTYFLKYDSLTKLIRNPNNTDKKYVGTIIGNLIDTFDIIYRNHTPSNFESEYAGNMSLMQAIYIQQDFIEELLFIFRSPINKGGLKQDENYNTNRDIRNELMGHPIRKFRGGLVSTTLLNYNGPKGHINYSRSHIDNGFSRETLSHSIEEIIDRHSKFIDTYFEKILVQIRRLMKPFIKRLSEFEATIDTIDFSKVLDFTFQYFEAIEKEEFIYDKNSLKTIYEKRETHPRYQNLINRFYVDLKEAVKGHLENIEDEFNPKEIKFQTANIPPITINIMKMLEGAEPINTTAREEIDYGYYLGKLATEPALFEPASNVLKKDFLDNQIVVEELEHMKNNRYNKIEYYCAYRLLRQEVEKYDEAY